MTRGGSRAVSLASPPPSFAGGGWHWFWGALKQSKKALLGKTGSGSGAASAAHMDRHGSPRLYPRDAQVTDDGGSYWPRGVYTSSTPSAAAADGAEGVTDYHLGIVQAYIKQHRLAPFYDGAPDEPEDPLTLPALTLPADAGTRSELVATIREAVDHLKDLHLGPPHSETLHSNNNNKNHHQHDEDEDEEEDEEDDKTLHADEVPKVAEEERPTSRHRRYREGSATVARGLTRSLSHASARLKRRLSQKPSSPLQPQLDVDHATATPSATQPRLLSAATQPGYSGWQHPIECPICFLWYPENINYCRCCHQPICTECFVEIKRSENGEPAT